MHRFWGNLGESQPLIKFLSDKPEGISRGYVTFIAIKLVCFVEDASVLYILITMKKTEVHSEDTDNNPKRNKF